ncbi:hypothetical protein H8Z72_22765 (plasmid) [Xanthomonas citri pv. citri]|uniref:hypothetical protein n=1 Tax=Xanthomonas citri TaxID=346 RepID=UPI0019342122|nr:hypothetical protein [Xanthomonas citri]QRD62647.1 hypothetical protein H8Z74_23420 [Xanthomonas citri pv. citri]QRD67182.1 hypothetical protein H8Z73_22400 [Xanthomonas citri pv. citri]QRD71773.1 hypothetical protein H8Z72_22765 [Xanthomonas citri pv. citri]
MAQREAHSGREKVEIRHCREALRQQSFGGSTGAHAKPAVEICARRPQRSKLAWAGGTKVEIRK